MKQLAKVIRITSKIAFKKLHKKGYIYCEILGENILITNLFYSHISGASKKRKLRDIILRLSCIILVPTILLKGEIVETRRGTIIEGRFSDIAYQINYTISNIYFVVIVSLRKNRYYLMEPMKKKRI